MYNISVSRTAAIGALVAVSLLLAVLLAGAPKAAASYSQCSPHQVCVWSGANATGDFSWWWGSNTGCKSHAGIPTVRTTANYTEPYKVRLGGTGWILQPGASLVLTYTGDTCWPA
jgi:hypothetical protein